MHIRQFVRTAGWLRFSFQQTSPPRPLIHALKICSKTVANLPRHSGFRLPITPLSRDSATLTAIWNSSISANEFSHCLRTYFRVWTDGLGEDIMKKPEFEKSREAVPLNCPRHCSHLTVLFFESRLGGATQVQVILYEEFYRWILVPKLTDLVSSPLTSPWIKVPPPSLRALATLTGLRLRTNNRLRLLPGGQNFGQKAQKGPGKTKVGRKNLWPNFG